MVRSRSEIVCSILGNFRTSFLAKQIGVKPQAITGWRNRGVIPEGRRKAVLDLADMHGVQLAHDEREYLEKLVRVGWA